MPVALGIVKATALYVFLSLLVCIWGLGIELGDAKSAAADPTNFGDWFLWSGFWALPVLIVTVVLSSASILIRWRFSKRYRRIFNEENLAFLVLENLVGGLSYAFVNPFNGIRFLVQYGLDTDETGIYRLKSKAFSIFWFCWAVALIAYIALGLIAVS
jgi:hypothetical protein